MTYVGATPATNYIYKALGSDGKDATTSNITDNGTIVTVTADCIADKFHVINSLKLGQLIFSI